MSHSVFPYFSSLDAMDDLRGLSVVHGELVVTTGDHADCEALARCRAVLERVKKSLAIDVLFVSQVVEGVPVARTRSESDGEGCDILEADYGHAMLDEAVREEGGASRTVRPRLSIPVVTGDGVEYGTACLRSRGAGAKDAELRALRSIASMLAQALAQGTRRPLVLN